MMPLPDREQRELDHLAEQLAKDDPAFVAKFKNTRTSRGSSPRLLATSRWDILGVLGAVTGVILLVAGAASSLVWLGVVGFVLMLLGVYAVLNHWMTRHSRPMEAVKVPGAPKGPKATKTRFMDKMEERWERRRNQQG
jgi:hypothetical protein